MDKDNENEFTYEGVEYVAGAPTDDIALCTGCEFENDFRCCENNDFPHCTAEHRKDGRSIIWKRKTETTGQQQ